MNTIILKESDAGAARAGRVLAEGGIVAFPTDTVYGLGAVYTDRHAVRRIFDAKGRSDGKPLSILVCDKSQVGMLAAEIPDEAEKLMDRFWPGALTIIIRKNNSVPDEVAAGGETVGIRMPSNRTARAIIAAAGAPLAAPSANTSGSRSAVTAEDVKEDLAGKIDMIIDGGACEIGVSSTVIDLTGDVPKILREGTVTMEMLRQVIMV